MGRTGQSLARLGTTTLIVARLVCTSAPVRDAQAARSNHQSGEPGGRSAVGMRTRSPSCQPVPYSESCDIPSGITWSRTTHTERPTVTITRGWVCPADRSIKADVAGFAISAPGEGRVVGVEMTTTVKMTYRHNDRTYTPLRALYEWDSS